LTRSSIPYKGGPVNGPQRTAHRAAASVPLRYGTDSPPVS